MSEPRVEHAILSVNVGLPQVIATQAGAPVLSGIRKAPVARPTIMLMETGLGGDGQADLTVHGGPDKAVYAYPARHWDFWRREHGLTAGPGSFGENLTLEGPAEDEVMLGDLFAWGDGLLEVSQPRQPCGKLALHLGRVDIPGRLVQSARSGWYYRVRRGAEVSVGGTLVLVDRKAETVSVQAAFRAMTDPGTPLETLLAHAALPFVTAAWREGLEHRILARARR